MVSPVITMIVATDRNHCIGGDNKMLWHLPGDFKYFKHVTSGHPIIMGRKTFESIGRPLPNRTNIIITRNTNYAVPDGVVVCGDIDSAINHASTCDGGQGADGEIMVIGGATVYEQCMPLCHRIHLTEVDTVVAGDAHFPKIDPLQFTCKHAGDWVVENELSYRFTVWERFGVFK